MAYRVRWEGHGVYRRFYGTVSTADFRGAYDEITGDPRYEDIRYVLSDYLEAQRDPVDTEPDAAAFAHLEQLKFFNNPDIVHAAVVSDEKALVHMPCFKPASLPSCPVGVFPTVDAARHWIATNPRRHWARMLATAEPAASSTPHA